MLLQALLYGLAASSALVIGAVLGSYLKVPRRLVAAMLAFAAGAVLASLADTLMPEAYEDGGPFVAFATAAGFLLSFVLSEM